LSMPLKNLHVVSQQPRSDHNKSSKRHSTAGNVAGAGQYALQGG
jgi:hypothetical protein